MTEQPTTATAATPWFKQPAWLAVGVAAVAALVQLPMSYQSLKQTWFERQGPKITASARLSEFEVPVAADTLLQEPKDMYKSYITLGIYNEGDSAANDVRVLFNDNSGWCYIQGRDGEAKSSAFINVIEVGRIPHRESVECKIWTQRRLDPLTDSLDVAVDGGSLSVLFPEKLVAVRGDTRADVLKLAAVVLIILTLVAEVRRRKLLDHVRSLQRELGTAQQQVAEVALLRETVGEMSLALAEQRGREAAMAHALEDQRASLNRVEQELQRARIELDEAKRRSNPPPNPLIEAARKFPTPGDK